MAKNNEYASLLPKKILLSVFLFGLVLLAGRVLYLQFDGFSACFAVAPEESAGLASVSPQDIFAAANSASRHEDGDFALRLYRSEKTRDDVLEFFTGVTGDAGISEVILRYADANNISPSLAFALSWEESRFQPGAVNRNAASIDRGLFQLNDKSFPELSAEEMFDPETNARNGLTHLRFCMDQSGNEVTALAMYNAGSTKVRNGGTPKRTLDYVSRILAFRETLDLDLLQNVALKNL